MTLAGLSPQHTAWTAFGLGLAALLARRGLKKRSLSASGALAAFLVGAVHMCCGLQYGMTLIVFYLTSSKLTKLGASRKAVVEEEHKEGGCRSAAQVLANSLAACCLAELASLLASQPLPGPAAALLAADPRTLALLRAAVAGAFLGHYACCTADTWASELGILWPQPPRLITTGRAVPPGTNGGVSPLGLAASAAGGLAIGLAFYGAGWAGCALGAVPRGGSLCRSEAGGTWLGWGPADAAPLALLGLVCGLGGSLLDSLLGATVQFTGWDGKARRVVGRDRLWEERARAEAKARRDALGGEGKGKGEQEEGGIVRICGMPLLSNDGVNAVSAALTAGLGAVLLARCA
ncbi:hypothetical protein HYH03_018121 [Edaphochlamys debaryana]|uniref:Transmembrane protein 19 n=1 Tax=Edaphochlamys debaryana TaxID=47281 RepID=A0A836BN88_9CHLO|nr:hypothetical protein HYH03_018121 [Edaphochlamys debaryana]|eukprot:KAG2482996.1 hypothetical protein HYH03_018121 [Edaphochlamys debaryana]